MKAKVFVGETYEGLRKTVIITPVAAIMSEYNKETDSTSYNLVTDEKSIEGYGEIFKSAGGALAIKKNFRVKMEKYLEEVELPKEAIRALRKAVSYKNRTRRLETKKDKKLGDVLSSIGSILLPETRENPGYGRGDAFICPDEDDL